VKRFEMSENIELYVDSDIHVVLFSNDFLLNHLNDSDIKRWVRNYKMGQLLT